MKTEDQLRGTGRTTAQMIAAPKGALYVVSCTPEVGYAQRLARKCGREDLQVVAPFYLGERRFMGLRLSGIAVDHAARLTEDEHRGLEVALACIRRDSE